MTLFGAPIHPALAHLPIGLFIGAWILQMSGAALRKGVLTDAARAVYALAAFFAMAAAAAGLMEQNRLQIHHPLVDAHRSIGLALWGFSWSALGLMFLFRGDPAKSRAAFAFACWVSAALAVAAGYLGGEMVFHYGLGVSP